MCSSKLVIYLTVAWIGKLLSLQSSSIYAGYDFRLRYSSNLLRRQTYSKSDPTITVTHSSQSDDIPKSRKQNLLDGSHKQLVLLSKLINFYALSSSLVRADSSILSDSNMKVPSVNLPSDDFWYPPFMIGRWNTSLIFDGATFSNEVQLQKLSENNSVPGFSDLSVAFISSMGKDVQNLTLRYVQIDSHTREDHPFNIRQLIKAFTPNIEVTSAPYSFQKAPDWFHSEANRWKIQYIDRADHSEGTIDLYTRKRLINVFAGNVETTEFFTQTLTKSSNTSQPTRTIGDYAINWKLSTPASLKDEFVNVEDLRKTDRLVGRLNILVYLRPSHPLYVSYSRKGPQPVGVFSYNVSMQRIGDLLSETNNSVYPFVYRFDGPVELDKYLVIR